MNQITGWISMAALGIAAKLGSDETRLTVEHLRPLLDRWTDAGARFAAERLQ